MCAKQISYPFIIAYKSRTCFRWKNKRYTWKIGRARELKREYRIPLEDFPESDSEVGIRKEDVVILELVKR